MRQLVAAVLVVGSLAAPVVRTWCEIACLDGIARPAAATSHCHEASEEPAPVSVESPIECGDHSAAPAIAAEVKSQRDGLSPLMLELVSVDALDPAVAITRFRAASARGSTSPPIPPGSSILRI